MTSQSGSNHYSSILCINRENGVFFKAYLLCVLFLPALLASQPAIAVSSHHLPAAEETFKINAGLNDAWVNPDAPFQGMFVTVLPDQNLIFAAWFTFDLEPPPEDTNAVIGAADHRWITALGSYDGHSAVLNAELTTGGRFNSSDPIAIQDTSYGTIALNFSDCNMASVDFDFPGVEESGSFTMQRIVTDNVSLCEELGNTNPSKTSPQTLNTKNALLQEALAGFQINAGLNDAWVNPDAAFQGMFLTVFPLKKLLFAAWFTFESEQPQAEAKATIGSPDHRWITALGNYDGDVASLQAELTTGGRFNSSEPMARQNTDYGIINLEFANCENGSVEYNFPAAGKSGSFSIQRIINSNVALCETLATPPVTCFRPDPDPSHGPDHPPIVHSSIVPRDEILDGGPGPDGIPPLERPRFIQDANLSNLDPAELVVGVKFGDDIRAYPHNILNWHEVVNDQFTVDGSPERATLSYCPLTGSAMLWNALMESGNKTFGTSGLLYNSNLVMYDRATESLWSQMLEQSIEGYRMMRIPDRSQAVETTWGTWRTIYPETVLLSENTGFSRNYNSYPYGSYRENSSLLFPVNNSNDDRLHRKERVLGINVGPDSKVYPVANFSSNVEVINDTVGDMEVVVAGSGGQNFGVVFNRELEDCTVLDFEAVQNRLPVVMRDNEGNEWDIFGIAVSGARTGQQLQKTNSYISYWFAWTAFFPGAEVHQ
ncbi:DUF3179 domain-containing protein [Pseudomonadota bacterium]